MSQEKNFQGLTFKEAQKLLKEYGKNEVVFERPSVFKQILEKLSNPVTVLILVTLFISLLLGKHEESLIIVGLLVVNVFFELWQKNRAQKTIDTLSKKLMANITVKRDGIFVEVPSSEIVPGDVVKLVSGEVVPADAQVLHTQHLQVNESALTGESLPTEKGVGDKLFSGSVVSAGSAIVKIVATGKRSSLGKSEQLIKSAFSKQSHFEKSVSKMVYLLIFVAVLLSVVLFVWLVQNGESIFEALSFSLVLLIASVPVALPVVLSLILSIGALDMARLSIVVKNSKALEDLAGANILAVDKTGTLTKNKLTVGDVYVYKKYNKTDLAVFALAASEKEHKNEIEKAIEDFAKVVGALPVFSSIQVEKFIPFSSERKRTEAFLQYDGDKLHVLMGEPNTLKEFLPFSQQVMLLNATKRFASNGKRSLAVIVENIEKPTQNEKEKYFETGYDLVGVFALHDPLREDSKDAIESMFNLGVDVKMITGDNFAIAKYIGQKLNLGDRVTLAEKIRKLKEKTLYKLIKQNNIFAEVLPEDKFKFISTLQKYGDMVAMTGDGVNDAPALAKANAGIAVFGATSAAKEAADAVLLTEGLSVLKEVFVFARGMFARMQAYALFRISETIRLAFFIALSAMFFEQQVVTAAMIILLALLNDIPVLAIAYDNAPNFKKPVRWKMRDIFIVSSVLGGLGLASSFTLLLFLKDLGAPWVVIQTLMFLKLDVAGHSTLYTTRTLDKHFWERPWPSWKFFIPAFSSRVVGTLLAVFGIFMTPISWGAVAFVWVYASAWFLVADFVKVYLFKVLKRI